MPEALREQGALGVWLPSCPTPQAESGWLRPPGDRGPWERGPPGQISKARCLVGPARGAEGGPKPPGGRFMGTLGWGDPRAGLEACFTPVPRWRGGRATWVSPPGPGCEQTLRPVSRFPFSKSFPPLICQLLGRWFFVTSAPRGLECRGVGSAHRGGVIHTAWPCVWEVHVVGGHAAAERGRLSPSWKPRVR